MHPRAVNPAGSPPRPYLIPLSSGLRVGALQSSVEVDRDGCCARRARMNTGRHGCASTHRSWRRASTRVV